MQITKAILTKNPCYKAGKTIKVKGLMLHSVGCPQPSATVFIESWNTPNASVCVHGFIDGNTGGVYQTLPWNRRGWHCGGDANGTHIGIEMCEPGCIKYTSGAKFTCSDKEKAKAVVERTYKSAVELFAYLCKEYGLNPLAEGVILAHSEGSAKGLASNHADPEHLWKGLKMPYTMDGFRQDVMSAMNPAYYRVQVGAFTKEKNAKNLLAELKKAGFKGFITRG
jgi:N-acetyl-anhydromuramyl-L-alanine amidase AmpD